MLSWTTFKTKFASVWHKSTLQLPTFATYNLFLEINATAAAVPEANSQFRCLIFSITSGIYNTDIHNFCFFFVSQKAHNNLRFFVESPILNIQSGPFVYIFKIQKQTNGQNNGNNSIAYLVPFSKTRYPTWIYIYLFCFSFVSIGKVWLQFGVIFSQNILRTCF